MNMKPRFLAAMAALLLVVAGVVWGDNNTVDHGTYYGNASTGLKTDAAGNLYMTNSSPIQDNNLTFANCIGPTALTAASATAGADSSAILDTHTMRLGMLLIHCVPAGGAAMVNNRIAVQIRTHLLGAADTNSVYCVYNYGSTEVGTAGGKPDSVSFGHIASGSTSTLWSGEIDVLANNARNSTQTGGGANDYRSPAGIAVPLSSIFGRDFYSPYTSIRVRNLAGPTCTVTVSLVGTPL